jgi:hypothetical protein
MLDLRFIPAGAQFARNNMQREHTMKLPGLPGSFI